MVSIKRDIESGDYAFGNTFVVTHNRGNYPDKIFVWNKFSRPIQASEFTVVHNSANQFTVTFSNGAEYSGRFEALFTHLLLLQEGVSYELRISNGAIYPIKATAPDVIPDYPVPPGNT